jgi:hypothetical protein
MAGLIRLGAEDVLVLDKDTGVVEEIDRESLKESPEDYVVVHSNFEEPLESEIEAARGRCLRGIQWGPPNLLHEIPEFERASEHIGVTTIDLLLAAGEGPIVEMTPAMWSTMENTDSWETDSIEKAVELARLYDKNIRSVIQGFGQGVMQVPMALSFEDGSVRLIGGNTRLMTCRAFGVTPKVLLVRVPGKRSKGMAYDVAASFQQARLSRNVVRRFAARQVKD